MKTRLTSYLVVLGLLTASACGGKDSKKATDNPDSTVDLRIDETVTDTLVPDGAGTDAADSVVEPPPDNLLQYVNPMIGTGGLSYRIGSAFVGAALPFGLAKLGPDTKDPVNGEPGFFHCEGYFYPDSHVSGFSHMHIHGTGAPDYGSLLVVPGYGMDDSKVTESGYMLPLDHDLETNEPGYYRLTLGVPGILAELTSTQRVGVHRYTYPKTEDAVIIIDPSHVISSCEVETTEITIDAEAGTVEGMLFTGCALSGRFGGFPIFFSGQFRSIPVEAGVWEDDILQDGTVTAAGPETGAWFRFETDQAHPIELVMGISTVDLENARAHRKQEVGEKSFDDVREEAATSWNEAFGRGKVEFPSDTPDDVRIQYYTSLYHAFMMPMTWSEHDDRYLAFDDTVKQTDGFTFYTDFSMWDTYRNLHPLLFLLFPDESADMMRSLLEMGTYEGCLPHWVLANGDSGSMIGRPASIIVADAWLHGIPIQDEELMMKLLYQSHAVPVDNEDILPCSAEDGLQDSRKYGYIPADLHDDSVSMTQENAWGDYCVAVIADAKEDQEVATLLFEQSLNSYNLYYDVVGFFQGRNSDGSWVPDLAPFYWEEYYTEGNAWQYLWLVPHDPVGLAEIMGGEETFFARLDEFFTETEAWDDPFLPPRHYFHGNEPDIHASFLYSAMGRPASSAKWSRWIMDAEYFVSPEGLAGNDDAGTMAAWYAFATLGFYPFPCTGKYLLGTPRVSEAWLSSLGKPLHIVVEDASESRPYVKSVTWDGEPVETPWFTIEQLSKGGEVVFTMSQEPTDFGVGIKFPKIAGE